MKPTPILEFWQKPPGAGEPVAVIATTFALEPDFFEQNCLARFLEVSSVDEDTGSADDVVAAVELHELLQKAVVTVLADRSARVERTSLLWDLLSCVVDGGLLHAKVSVLMWENATRVMLGSANLTSAGYRRQIELALAADLGPGCLFPPEVLTAIADELDSYLPLVPGYDAQTPVFQRAAHSLALFRERVASQPTERSAVRVAFAPTNPSKRPLERLTAVWNGTQPLRATHLSPFWDTDDLTVLKAVRQLLTGRPASARSQHVAVVLGPRGQVSFPSALAGVVDTVRELKPLDTELRLLHAKCLLIENDQWVAALVGSSNHTRAGLGMIAKPHREINVWLGANRGSRAGKALLDLVQRGRTMSPDAAGVESVPDEDDTQAPALPPCFGLCRVTRANDEAPWELQLGITTVGQAPRDWSVGLPGAKPLLTRRAWEADGCPATVAVAIDQKSLPMFLAVQWNGGEAPWAVVADDRYTLPPGPALASLRAQHLLDALATGRSLGNILRDELERAYAGVAAQTPHSLDPLRRLEVHGSLLRRGRALAASLSAMQRRLERQVITLDTLRARLAGPLGPDFVATKVVEAYETGHQSRQEAIFTIAEIALTVGRVSWSHVLAHVDDAAGRTLVEETLQRLDASRRCVGNKPVDIASYSDRAIQEARRCLVS